MLAFAGTRQLYLRDMSQPSFRPVPGTAGAEAPFFSPDGQWVGFWLDGQLSKVAIAGGAPVTITESARVLSASWEEDDTILLSVAGSGISRVAAGGGDGEVLVPLEGVAIQFLRPQLLPGGEWLLFVAYPRYEVVAQSLVTGERRVLFEDRCCVTSRELRPRGSPSRTAPTPIRFGLLRVTSLPSRRIVRATSASLNYPSTEVEPLHGCWTKAASSRCQVPGRPMATRSCSTKSGAPPSGTSSCCRVTVRCRSSWLLSSTNGRRGSRRTEAGSLSYLTDRATAKSTCSGSLRAVRSYPCRPDRAQNPCGLVTGANSSIATGSACWRSRSTQATNLGLSGFPNAETLNLTMSYVDVGLIGHRVQTRKGPV